MRKLLLLIPLVILAGLLYWLWWRLLDAPQWSPAWKWGLTGLGVKLTVFMFAQFLNGPAWITADMLRPVARIGAIWVGVLQYLILGTLVSALISAGWWVFAREDTAVRLLVNRVGAVVTILVAVAVTLWGISRAANPMVTHTQVHSAELPAEFSGLRIAVLADLHVGPVLDASFTRQVVQKTMAEKPDLIVLPGDLIDGHESRFGPALAPLKDLQAPLGVYAVTGNHEIMSGQAQEWKMDWEKLGVRVLSNENVVLRRGKAQISLAGVEDRTATGMIAPDYAATLRGTSGFTLLIAHQPKQALKVQGQGVNLQISGHTHGGQMWPFHYLVLLDQPMLEGLATIGDVPTFTSRGAGAWGPPVRVGADPEIPIVTLHRSQ